MATYFRPALLVEFEQDTTLPSPPIEAHFRQLADAMPQFIWFTDAQGALQYINDRWFAYTHISQEETLRQGLWPALHPDDLSENQMRWESAVQSGEPYEAEVRLRRADGEYRWHLERAVPMRGENGLIHQWLGTSTDIHAQKQAETALRASEEKFAKVFHAGPLVITITRLADGRFIEVNESFVRLTGYKREDVLGSTPVELGLWVEPAQRAVGLAQLRAGLFMRNTEVRFRMKDGSERTCLISAEMIEIEGETCVVTVLNDITERKQAEQRLQFLADVGKVLAASLEYEVTLQQVATLMVPQLADLCTVEIVGANGVIEPVATAHIDSAKTEWVRQLRRRYPPSFEEPNGIGQVIRTGHAVFHPGVTAERLQHYARDEEHIILLRQVDFRSVIIVPLQVREETYGALTLVRSASEHRYTEADLQFAEEIARRVALAVDNARLYREAREAESQLKQLNAQLEQRVHERTVELERSNRELDRFAYVASHDLRSPLRGIENLVNFIREDSGEMLPEPSKKHLATLQARVKRMDTLLTDLLAYSRASRQKHPFEAVDVAALVYEVVELLAPPPGFTVGLGSTMPALLAERIPLETIFRNLIGNAIKHHAHPADGRVTVEAQVLGSLIEFTVRDNGPGIDPLFHERIFEIFQTLKPRDQVEGSGIGLTVVRQLVESRGGRIWVESSPGQGAAFRFTWPQ